MSSLMDSLLLEPQGWRVQGVYIAKRTDPPQGFGSGTQSDPWRPIIRNTPAITVQKAENLPVESNIIDLGQASPINFQKKQDQGSHLFLLHFVEPLGKQSEHALHTTSSCGLLERKVPFAQCKDVTPPILSTASIMEFGDGKNRPSERKAAT